MRYLRETERPDDFQVDLGADLFRGLRFANFGRVRGSLKYVNECDPVNPGALTGFTGAGNTPPDRWGRALGRACLSTQTTGDYVALTGSAVLTGVPISMSCWFNPDEATSDGYTIALGTSGGSGQPFFGLAKFGSLTGDPLRATSGGIGYASSARSFLSGAWQHGAAVFTSATARQVYLDGVAGTDNAANNTPTSIVYGTIGGLRRTTLTAQYFGLVSDVVIWSRALSPSEISQLADPQWSVMMGGAIYTRPNRSLVGQGGSAMYTGSGSATVGKATASASGLYSPVVYTGTGSPAAAKATASASGTFVAPVYTGTGAPSTTKATASASATFVPPVYAASGSASTHKVTAAATGTFIAPIYTGSGSPSARKATASASATYGLPAYTGAGSVTVTKTTASASGTCVNPVYIGDGSVTVTKAIASASATYTPSIPIGTISPVVITKHGTTTPTVFDLADFQLGFDSAAGKLYVRSGASIILIGPP